METQQNQESGNDCREQQKQSKLHSQHAEANSDDETTNERTEDILYVRARARTLGIPLELAKKQLGDNQKKPKDKKESHNDDSNHHHHRTNDHGENKNSNGEETNDSLEREQEDEQEQQKKQQLQEKGQSEFSSTKSQQEKRNSVVNRNNGIVQYLQRQREKQQQLETLQTQQAQQEEDYEPPRSSQKEKKLMIEKQEKLLNEYSYLYENGLEITEAKAQFEEFKIRKTKQTDNKNKDGGCLSLLAGEEDNDDKGGGNDNSDDNNCGDDDKSGDKNCDDDDKSDGNDKSTDQQQRREQIEAEEELLDQQDKIQKRQEEVKDKKDQLSQQMDIISQQWAELIQLESKVLDQLEKMKEQKERIMEQQQEYNQQLQELFIHQQILQQRERQQREMHKESVKYVYRSVLPESFFESIKTIAAARIQQHRDFSNASKSPSPKKATTKKKSKKPKKPTKKRKLDSPKHDGDNQQDLNTAKQRRVNGDREVPPTVPAQEKEPETREEFDIGDDEDETDDNSIDGQAPRNLMERLFFYRRWKPKRDETPDRHPLVRWLRRERVVRNREFGWLRKQEAELAGTEIPIPGKTKISYEERKLALECYHIIRSLPPFVCPGYRPLKDLGHAYGVTYNAFSRFDRDFVKNGFSSDKPARANLGGTILTSDTKRRSHITPAACYVKSRVRQCQEKEDPAPSHTELRKEFHSLSDEDKAPYIRLAEEMQEKAKNLKDKLEEILKETKGDISYRMLEEQLNSDFPFPIASKNLIRHHITANKLTIKKNYRDGINPNLVNPRIFFPKERNKRQWQKELERRKRKMQKKQNNNNDHKTNKNGNGSDSNSTGTKADEPSRQQQQQEQEQQVEQQQQQQRVRHEQQQARKRRQVRQEREQEQKQQQHHQQQLQPQHLHQQQQQRQLQYQQQQQLQQLQLQQLQQQYQHQYHHEYQYQQPQQFQQRPEQSDDWFFRF